MRNPAGHPVEPPPEDAPLQGMLAHVLTEMDGQDSDLRAIVASLGHRAFGPVMVLCGLFLLTPIGALPGVPVAFALINIVFAVQLLARRPHPWVPDVLAKVRLPHARVAKAEARMRPWLAKVDNIVGPRLAWATEGPMLVLCALVTLILSVCMVMVGMIPFGVVPFAAVIGLMGLALIARDGLLMLIALSVTLGGVVAGVVLAAVHLL